MTVLVTGAAGHLGGVLVRQLLEQGRRVRALVHQDDRAIQGLELERVRGTLDDPQQLAAVFAGCQTIFHLAAHISLQSRDRLQTEQVNLHGTARVVDACLAAGVPTLVHVSSIHAFQQTPRDQPLDEQRPLIASRRAPAYDRSKAAAEAEIERGARAGLRTTILYPTGIIGPFDFKPSHFGEVLLRLAEGRLPALVTGGFDWVDVRDVAQALLAAEQLPDPGGRFLLSGHYRSLHQIAACVAGASGRPAPWLTVPLGVAKIAAPFSSRFAAASGSRPLFTPISLRALESNPRISHARASAGFGYAPRPLEETIQDALAWFGDPDGFARTVSGA